MTTVNPSILLIDNYDSFTYNLFDYLVQAGSEVQVCRNDALSLTEITEKKFDGIVLSPGPKTPKEAGILMAVIEAFHSLIPMLGICLGHQGIGEHFGAKLVRANSPRHGKTSPMLFEKHWIFEGIESPTEVMRYHSLILKEIPNSFDILAETKEGEIMAIAHKNLSLIGLQFHPESILTLEGKKMISNWVNHIRGLSS